MDKNQIVAEMAVDVLARQAGKRANRTGEPFEEATGFGSSLFKRDTSWKRNPIALGQ